MDIRSVADHIKDTPFLNELLAEFVVRGLGSLPGRETTITLVGLLLKHHPGWRDSPPHDYELARLLRTSPRKIRNIRNELSYRAATHDDDWCRSELAQELERAELLSDGKLVSFQIDDGLVRDFAQKLVREQYGLVEYGLNSAIMKVSRQHFAELALLVMPQKGKQRLLQRIHTHSIAQDKSPVQLFLDAFAKSAGDKAGAQIARSLIAAATGGFSEVGKLFDLLKAFIRVDEAS